MERQNSRENSGQNSLRERLAQKQTELDETLANLSDEVELWNLRLEHVANTDPHADEVLPQIAQEAVNSLEEKWSFFGDKIHITGKWHVTDLTMCNGTMTFPMQKQDAFSIANSNGFAAFQEVDEPPRVGLSFEIGYFRIMNAAIQGPLQILAYANPREVSLYYVQPGEKESLQSDTSNLGNEITYYDQLLFLHYHDEKSEFYRKSARKQQQFLDGVADAINDSLPSPEHGYPAICEQVEVPYVYRRITDSIGNRWELVKAANSEPILLNGIVQGVGILEAVELTNKKPLRSKQELIDPNAGICLILQVEECSIPNEFSDQPVYVPLRIADNIEIAAP